MSVAAANFLCFRPPASTSSVARVRTSNAALTSVERTTRGPRPGSTYSCPPQGATESRSNFFPYGDLAHAQSVVHGLDQNMTSDIHVYLENGSYQANAATDDGTARFGHEWISGDMERRPRGKCIISGAEQIAGWKLSDASRNIWAASVPADLQTRQIYVNGMRATLASSTVPTGLSITPTGYRAHTLAMSHWRNPNDIDFVYTGQVGLMAEPICPVAAVAGRTITMAEPCWTNSVSRGAIWWVTVESRHQPTSRTPTKH